MAGTCDQVIVALRKIVRAIELHSRALVQKYGITGPQLVVLRQLASRGELPVGRLAENASLSQATMTVILDRLEQRGLVARLRSRIDRRRVLVSLTDAGKKMLAGNPSLLQERFVSVFERLARSEQERILRTLEEVVAMMSASDLEVAPILSSGPAGASADDTTQYLHEHGSAGDAGGQGR
jgi:DNA-binding MarR family transcriptional regulator